MLKCQETDLENVCEIFIILVTKQENISNNILS